MSRTKRFLEESCENSLFILEAALSDSRELLDFSYFVYSLCFKQEKGLEIVETIVQVLRRIMKENPEYFLTCQHEGIRELARFYLRGNFDEL